MVRYAIAGASSVILPGLPPPAGLLAVQDFREVDNSGKACAHHADVPVGHVLDNPYPHVIPRHAYSFELAGWRCCGKTLDSLPGELSKKMSSWSEILELCQEQSSSHIRYPFYPMKQVLYVPGSAQKCMKDTDIPYMLDAQVAPMVATPHVIHVQGCTGETLQLNDLSFMTMLKDLSCWLWTA